MLIPNKFQVGSRPRAYTDSAQPQVGQPQGVAPTPTPPFFTVLDASILNNSERLLKFIVRVQPLNLLSWQKKAILLGLKQEYEQSYPIEKEHIPAISRSYREVERVQFIYLFLNNI